MNETEYSFLKHKIHLLLNVDIDAYKSQQMRRRLESFVARKASGKAALFCKSLEHDPNLLKELEELLTINVSEFFRDMRRFDELKSVILPELLHDSSRLNIWTAGCSHGEEPYSVAIILNEISTPRRHRIIATDLDDEVLKVAKAGGPYGSSAVSNVPKWQLQKYFTHSDDSFVVAEEIRDRVEFRKQNLLSDAFERGFDLIICRNVMIYFSEETKNRLFQKFSDSLRPGGVLFLGATEAMLSADEVGFSRILMNFYRKAGPSLAETRRKMAA